MTEHVPGEFRCPECSFVLTKSIINQDGEFCGRDSSDRLEPCPNDGSILRPVRWDDAMREARGEAVKIAKEARAAQDEARLLRTAISDHRAQKADDRCWMDDDLLYESLGDGIKCDRRVGDKAEMLRNCQRFIERRCEGGGWPTYAKLEALVAKTNTAIREACRLLPDYNVGELLDARPEARAKTILLNLLVELP